MLLMPYLGRETRPVFPLAVIAIVLINLVVYFGFQQRDGQRWAMAADYYHNSILHRLEPRAYQDFLKERGKAKSLETFRRALADDALPTMLRMMESDAPFMAALREERIIRPDHPDYRQWRQARRYYQSVRDAIVVERYAFHGDRPTLLAALTHQFLHADAGHLAGNMVVFALIAPAVEALLGLPAFVAIYLLGGLGAVGTHWLLMGDGGSLVGASGAISAVMGAFAALLRWRRIPFFFFAVVYFDIIRAPALLALPIWLANEALQLFWLGNARVAYGAHMGGLATGALLAWPFHAKATRFLAPPPADSAQDDGSARLEAALANARRLIRQQRFDEGRQAYARVAALAGRDAGVLRECANVAKLSAASPEYHQVASAIFRLAGNDGDTHALVRDTFGEYLRTAQPRPDLDAAALDALSDRFLRHGNHGELQKLARLLAALAPAHPRRAAVTAAAGTSL